MRATSDVARRRRKKRLLHDVKGYWGYKSKLYRYAMNAWARAMQYAFRDRKVKKRDFRALWIMRINAACRMHDMTYSQFVYGLKNANIDLNRKMLSEIAIQDADAFKVLVDTAKKNIHA